MRWRLDAMGSRGPRLASVALALLGSVAVSRTAAADDPEDISPLTPLLPSEPRADPVPGESRTPQDRDPSGPPTRPADGTHRNRDRQLTNPTVITPSAAEFCSPGAMPRPNRTERMSGDKWARLIFDTSCSHHDLHCVGGGLTPRHAAPTGCLEVASFDGQTRLEPEGAGAGLECARCPKDFGTDGSFAICSDTQIRWAEDANLLIYDIRAADRERWEQTGGAALTAVTSARSTAAAKKEAALQLLDLVREMADTLFYCRDVQPYLPSPSADHPEATYVTGRTDLNRWMVWGGLTAIEGTGMEIGAADGTFHVYPAAFRGPLAGEGTGFSVDSIIMELVHEMRHMATYNHGDGEPGQSEAVKDAEHRVNEQEDYAMMFRHPYFATIRGDVAARLKADFLGGRDDELTCLASVWPVDATTHGYPPDTSAAPSAALKPGMGMMGLGIPLGLGVRPGKSSVVSPMAPVATTPERCFRGSPLTADERCRVAAWARSNVIMRSFMVRTLGITEYPQPWNTLAHWSLLLPFRAHAACDANGHYVGGAAPAATGRGR